MKHPWKITIILLSLFLITQFIGLFVVNHYMPRIDPETNQTINPLPAAFQTPEPTTDTGFWYYFAQIIPAFILAVILVLILTKYKWKFFIKLWFFIVILIALALAFDAILKNLIGSTNRLFGFTYIALSLGLIFSLYKIYRPNVLVHNFTELLIYPGIAAIFVPILNIYTIIALLIIISIYDMWAVWHSGIMQKMAKFQMEELKIFGGFFIPHMSKKLRQKIKNMKKSKSKKTRNQKIKVNLAILGGGDVVFPIITAGVVLKFWGLIPALFTIAGAFVGLAFLLSISQKKKFYPAMPFISAGLFLGMLIGKLFFA